MSELKTDRVIAKQLIITDAEDREVAQISPSDGGAGLWIKGPGGDVVAVYSINGQTGIGIYDKESLSERGNGLPIALSIHDGMPYIQFRDEDGEIRHLCLSELRKMLLNMASTRDNPAVEFTPQERDNPLY